ncbi:unnamed protein product [Echinostoma caproni]|uniref:Uncharacterized protein n=1 Tax=Echinostoma caproni TaxID=27848 RepID=A0A3P8GJU1_9TREM|nr:unnamed protein product [Echinostoma caproni]
MEPIMEAADEGTLDLKRNQIVPTSEHTSGHLQCSPRSVTGSDDSPEVKPTMNRLAANNSMPPSNPKRSEIDMHSESTGLFIDGKRSTSSSNTTAQSTPRSHPVSKSPNIDTDCVRREKLTDFLPPVPKLPKGSLNLSENSSTNMSRWVSPRDPRSSPMNSGRTRASTVASSLRSTLSQKEKLNARIRTIQSTCQHMDDTTPDLCYICHQRRARNVPVDLKEETKRHQEAEDALLVAYQQIRAQNSLKQELRSGIRSSLSVLLNDPKFRRYSTRMDEEFVISLNSNESELDRQIAQKETEISRLEEEERTLGRLEQARLAEQLHAEREILWQKKIRQQKEYKSALDFQVKHKPDPIPRAQANDGAPIFGAHHFDPVKLREARERIQAVHQAQWTAAQERSVRDKKSKEDEFVQECDMLKRVRRELICDGLKRREAQEAMRQYLESEWVKAIQEKKDREQLEELFLKQPSDLVLHEQCAAIKRCGQCQRKLDNVGQLHLAVQTHAPQAPYVM